MSTLTAIPVEEDWIVCCGETRTVTDGAVACPMRDKLAPVTQCLDCHLLSWVHDERSLRLSCTVGLVRRRSSADEPVAVS